MLYIWVLRLAHFTLIFMLSTFCNKRNNHKFQRYRNDPEWDDVHPLPLTDDEQAAVRIETSDAFNDAFMYLRAVVLSNEMSERAFKLTKK